MVYTPPKYPAEIPTIEDLPNRQDDVHWIKAARYNELKKELRAALTELGTLPKGTYADVKARLDAMLPHFNDRGDPVNADFISANLTKDGHWYDLDLSSIVPEGTKAVLLNVVIRAPSANASIYFRKNGKTNEYAKSGMHTQVAGGFVDNDLVVPCDAGRIIEYWVYWVTWTNINITVGGWWK